MLKGSDLLEGSEAGAGDTNRAPRGRERRSRSVRQVDPRPRRGSTLETLRGCVVLVNLGSEARAFPLRAALSALGATVVAHWSPLITHLVWGEGGNRGLRATARLQATHVVSPLWVEACAASVRHYPEHLFPSSSRPSDIPSPKSLQQLLIEAELNHVLLPERFDRSRPRRSGSRSPGIGSSAVGSTSRGPPTNATPACTKVSENPKPGPSHPYPDTAGAAASAQDRGFGAPADRRFREDTHGHHPTTSHSGNHPRHHLGGETNDFPRASCSKDTSFVSVSPCLPKLRDLALSVIYEESKKLINLDFTGMYLTPEGIDPSSRVNTAPRRALPVSPPSEDRKNKSKTRRKLFTQREPANEDTTESDEDRAVEPKRGRNRNVEKEANSRPQDAEQYICSAHGDRVARPTRGERGASSARVAHVARAERKRRDAQDGLDILHYKRAERKARKLVKVCTIDETKLNRPRSRWKQRRYRIVLTSMTKEERSKAKEACHELSAKMQRNVNEKTTHVIVGTLHEQTESQNLQQSSGKSSKRLGEVKLGDDIEQLRTFSALAGAVRGCRVLRLAWAIDSLATGWWIPHFGYEVRSLKKISQKAHVERKAFHLMGRDYTYNLFDGQRVKLSSTLTNAEAVSEILALSGAIVLDHNDVVQCNKKHGTDAPNAAKPVVVLGHNADEINTTWLVDCVVAARIRNFRRYVNIDG